MVRRTIGTELKRGSEDVCRICHGANDLKIMSGRFGLGIKLQDQ